MDATPRAHLRSFAGAARSWPHLIAPVLLAIVWIAVALATPRRTYHLAPLFIAASGPIVLRASRDRIAWRQAARVGAWGAAIAASVAIALDRVGALEGPSVIGGTALTESIWAVGAGIVWGLRVARRPCPGGFVKVLARVVRRSTGDA